MPSNLNAEIDRVAKTTPVRAGWKILGSLFAALLLVFGTMQVAVALAHKEYTDLDSFDAAMVSVVEVDNTAGSVRIFPAAEGTDRIDVTARVSDGLRETGHDERIDDDRLMLTASCPNFGSHFCDVDYVIRVPSDIRLHVRAVDGINARDISAAVDFESESGSVEVVGLSGPSRLRSFDGDVTATDLRSAEVDASTISGDVYVDFDSSPRSVRAKNIDGDVEVVIPDDPDAAFRVDTSTVDGSLDDPIRTDPAAERSIVAETISGNVIVRYS